MFILLLAIFTGCREVPGSEPAKKAGQQITDGDLREQFLTLERELTTAPDTTGIITIKDDPYGRHVEISWNHKSPEYIELMVYGEKDTVVWYKRDALGNITLPDTGTVLTYMEELTEFSNK